MAITPTPLISHTTPLGSGVTWTSDVQQLTRATQIVGSVFADQTGTIAIQQGGDGIHFDAVTLYNVPANTGVAISVPVIDQFFRVVYTNGSTAQTAFRLFVNIQDPYGAFLAAPAPPSPGGNYLVLYLNANDTYQIVGRFDAGDSLGAIAAAAISSGKSGQYASFPIADATVSIETVIRTTEHTIASF